VLTTGSCLALISPLRSNFFGPMATALMGGITVTTVLTLFQSMGEIPVTRKHSLFVD
jgi:multidrug efflux pump subunit AcrB